MPPGTRVDELEGAIRAVCEPHFDRPLKDISLGQVLLRLFQTSRRFNVEIQPQLVLLQKTLLNVEGLGRQLDPELDLWSTAKPFLERWMDEQIGWRGLLERLKNEAPRYAQLLPELPRLLHDALAARAPAPTAARCCWRCWPSSGAPTGCCRRSCSSPSASCIGAIVVRIMLADAALTRARIDNCDGDLQTVPESATMLLTFVVALPARHDRHRPVGRHARQEHRRLRDRRPHLPLS